MPAPAPLLVLTVGTGTAGPNSNLVAGLRAALRQTAPDRFWLVPSTDEISLLTADEVRVGLGNFSPWTATQPYAALAHPDDLEACRLHLRTVLDSVASNRLPGQRLLLNPTSGTKQMTAAAVLAALDLGLGEIVFIAGDRADGVVVTGTERLVRFDASTYFQEHDLAAARELFGAGAFEPAARILRRHAASLPRARSLCLALHHWRRFAYAEAVSAATGYHEDLRRALAQRAQQAAEGTYSRLIVADVLAWADHSRRLGDAGDCLTLAYKAFEIAARLALVEACGLRPTRAGRFDLAAVLPHAHSDDTRKRLNHLARGGDLGLGLSLACTLLAENGHPLGQSFDEDPRLRDLTYVRNESVHELRPPAMSEAQALLDRVQNLVNHALGSVPPTHLPTDLPGE